MMKRKTQKIVGLFLLLTLLFQGFVFAETDTVTLTDSVSGIEGQYVPADILMGGEDVISDVPAILYVVGGATRTLVPVRFISENLGATVKWDGATREVSIFYKDKLIVLTIDSPVAYVNDVAYTLPNGVPPKLMDYQGIDRTLVPIRFISDQLGMDVGWINPTRTVTIDKPFQKVTGLTHISGAQVPEIVLNTTGEVSANAFAVHATDLGGTEKLIVEIPNAQMNLGPGAILDASGAATYYLYEDGVNTVRMEQVSTNPYKIRVTMELMAQMGYELISEKNQLTVRFINSIVDLRTEDIYGAKTVIIKGVEEPKYNISYWEGKVIVDFMDAVLRVNGGKNGNFQVNEGGVAYVSYSQLNPVGIYEAGDSVSRVVVTLGPGMSYDNVYMEHIGTDFYVYVAQTSLDNFDYAKDAVDRSHLSLTALYPTSMTKSYNANNRTLSLQLPIDAIGLTEFTEHLDDNLIERMSVTSSGSDYLIKLVLEPGVTYNDLTPAGNSDIFVLSFENSALKYEPYVKRLVVIDPGHGGKDPGAVNGTAYEKNFNLAMGLKLKKKLENIGFTVYMTRDYDAYVGLYDRAYIANDLNADAFVSIHINSSETSNPSGISVLYKDDARNSKSLASMVLSKLLAAIPGVKSMGLSDRPNLVVLRETKIPAVMAELGFISNPNDLNNLKSEAYQDLLVEGLYQGLIQYLK